MPVYETVLVVFAVILRELRRNRWEVGEGRFGHGEVVLFQANISMCVSSVMISERGVPKRIFAQ